MLLIVVACTRHEAPLTTTTEASAPTKSELLRATEDFATESCACKDMDCATAANAKLAARDAGVAPQSEEDAVQAALAKGIGCAMKVKSAASVAPSASAPTPTPKVSDGAIELRGALAQADIQTVVHRSFARFKICYTNALAAKPSLKGSVRVQFTIAGTGSVVASEDAGSGIGDASVVRCVVEGMRMLTFPKPQGGGVAITTYTLVFSND
jgi:hypothetical protein